MSDLAVGCLDDEECRISLSDAWTRNLGWMDGFLLRGSMGFSSDLFL